MAEGPVVSVIVPTHNRAHLLGEALDSIISQEGAGRQFAAEIIVVDDASTDATAGVVSHYSNIRYIRLPERRNPSGARNAGIAASRGEYVAFLDDDDLWLPHKLRVQLPLLASHQEAGAVYSQVITRLNNQETLFPESPRSPSGGIYQALLKRNVCGGFLGFLLRRSALETAGPFDETLLAGEDYDLWLRLAFHFPILFLPGPVAIYRPSPQGNLATVMAEGRHVEEIRRIAERALALLPDTAAAAQLKREARAWAEERVIRTLAAARDARWARPRIIEALRQCPSVIEDDDVQACIALMARRGALASPSPISATRTFCSQIAEAVDGNGLCRHRRALRRLLATIWAAVAGGLFLESPPHRRAAWSAMACALPHDPPQLARKVLRALLRRTQHRTHAAK